MKLIIFILLFSLTIYADTCPKQVKIAVIDTGFGYKGHGKGAKLCVDGHKDFTAKTTGVPKDNIGHGTNVVGLIEKSLKTVNYCIIVIKYYHPASEIIVGWENLESTIQAFDYVAKIKPEYVNYSSGGSDPSPRERRAVERYLNGGGTLVTAAGNDDKELGKNVYSGYYPAMYDKRIVVVGNLNANRTRQAVSNYGKLVNRWEIGQNATAYGIKMSGTSQAAAIATGKIVLENSKKCDIGKQ
jgi:subtilisin family serine protease